VYIYHYCQYQHNRMSSIKSNPQPTFVPQCERPSFTPTKKATCKITVLCTFILIFYIIFTFIFSKQKTKDAKMLNYTPPISLSCKFLIPVWSPTSTVKFPYQQWRRMSYCPVFICWIQGQTQRPYTGHKLFSNSQRRFLVYVTGE
jgi:hypothetical protein